MQIEARRGAEAAVRASRIPKYTVDREEGIKAAMRYLRLKGIVKSRHVMEMTEAHKNAIWATGGFIAGLLVGLGVLVVNAVG